MKRIILTILINILTAQLLMAQSADASLLLQSPEGKTVKLMWFFKTWDASVTGFDIKRKEGSGDWVKLNKTPILPEVSAGKDLSAVESDPAELDKLSNKLRTLLLEKKLKAVDNQTYLKNLSEDKNALQTVAMVIAMDYDIALINGFAFVDRSVRNNARYEYGVFAQGSNKLIARTAWNYGDKPDLNIVGDITTRTTAKKNLLQLLWATDPAKLQSLYVAGFNIYREGKKLNRDAVMAANKKDMTEFNWFDSVRADEAHQYAVSAVTIFGIEGTLKSYTHDPSTHPSEYFAAELGEIASEGDNFNKGIRVNWTFPAGSERYLKGYFLEKANLPGDYAKVGEVNDPAARTFIDQTFSPGGGYIKYRITAVYKDDAAIKSADKLFYYFPMTRPPAPKNLKANAVKKGKGFVVELTWDKAAPGDTVTDYYQIYATDPVTRQLYLESGIEPIRGTSYSYPLGYGDATRYQFCISAMSRYRIEGALSDTASVSTPSLRLPYPAVQKLSLDSNKVTVQWQYPEISDVKGFRIYQNGNMVASEFEIKKEARQFITPSLKWGANYNFSVQAVTEYGVESEISVASGITISPTKNK